MKPKVANWKEKGGKARVLMNALRKEVGENMRIS